MNRVYTDVRLALRALLRQPGFFAIALITLALGVGSVSAIFSVVNGVLLQPLPYPDADRVLVLRRDQPPYGGPISRPLLEDWRAATSEVFSEVAAMSGSNVNLTGAGNAERLSAFQVSPEFWQVMSLPAQHGRYFTAEEERENRRVTVLGHSLWQRRFGGDPGLIGRDIELNGEAHRVIGVVPASFRYPSSADLYLPTYLPANTAGRDTNFLFVIARLRDGASLAQASAALAAANTHLASTYPDNHTGLSARLTPLPQFLTGDVRQPLQVLLGASLLVLLIAGANLANLLLARGSSLRRELAVRAALGAGRRQLLRAVLIEAAVLGVAGGLGGIAVAMVAVPALLAHAPGVVPSHGSVAMNMPVLMVSLLVALLAVLGAALIPALRAAATRPGVALQEDGRAAGGGRRRQRARTALVVAEVALSLTLLAGAGLLIESLRQLTSIDTGMRSDGVLTAAFSLSLPPLQGSENFLQDYYAHSRAVSARLDPIIERLAAIPGVEHVGVSDALPMAGHDNVSSGVRIVGDSVARSDGAEPGANWRFVNPDFLATLGIELLQGRGLQAADQRPGELPSQVLANATFVRRYLGDGDPIGREVEFLGGPKTIVGVVGDTRLFGIEREPTPEIYMNLGYAVQNQFYVALKVRGEPMEYAETLRRTMHEIDPAMPLFELAEMDRMLAEGTQLRRFNMTLMGVFSAVALALAAIGLYGVIAYAVAERRQEFGIRMSLGARAVDVLAMVMRQGLGLVGIGIALGLVGALLLGHLLGSQLYGVRSSDPWVLASVVAVLGFVAMLACLVPALRVVRIDPIVALRSL